MQAEFLGAIMVPEADGCSEVRLIQKCHYDLDGYIVPHDQFGAVMAGWFTSPSGTDL
jgi:hypothetical protein